MEITPECLNPSSEMYQVFRNLVEDFKAKLVLANDDVKPLTGTDVTGPGQHQYFRIAIISTKDAKPRNFILFAETSWLIQECRKRDGSPEWLMAPEWNENYHYIQELIRKPFPGDTLDDYSKVIDKESAHVWVSLFEFCKEQQLLERSLKMLTGKAYGIPSAKKDEK